ncbi:hypothetical protein [Portibacter marinus]|uniref:hypothetical protein n=1 Tax=Portibacter marinus TaxID=2898660 RepID=UPI001F3DF3FE|nr:hypothetical protein [Portibacter marinus]
MKRYSKIVAEHEPQITGSPNGVYAVELVDNKSFVTKEEEDIFKLYVSRNHENIQRVCEDSFVNLDNQKISQITYYPAYKSIKEIDVIQYSPYYLGFQLLVSQRLFRILASFNLPNLNKLKSKITNFNSNYFLIGFPMIENKNIDFKRSIFFDYGRNEKKIYKNYQQYSELNFTRIPHEIYLTKQYNYDVINIQGEGLFLSENLIAEIEKHKISGIIEKKSILHN